MNENIKRLIIIYFCGLALIFFSYFSDNLILEFIAYSIGYIFVFFIRRIVK